MGSQPLDKRDPYKIMRWDVPEVGLVAHLVLDNIALGPAAGGIRTHAYDSSEEALEDAKALARAMTVKSALAGLDAGGGKMVIEDHPHLDRARAFAIIGKKIEALNGLFRTGADLGTTQEDIQALSDHTQYGHMATKGLTDAVGMGVLRCIEACQKRRGLHGVSGLKVVVQGAGSMGSAVANSLSNAGAHVFVTDLNLDASKRLAHKLNIETLPTDSLLNTIMDVFCPCATGGIVDEIFAQKIQTDLICGAANNILAHPETASILHARDILFVPDTISSAGAVIEGIGKSVMGLPDCTHLIQALGDTTHGVLSEAERTNTLAEEVAINQAWERIDAAG